MLGMALNFLAVINPPSVHMSCHYILFVSSFTVCLDFFNTQNYFFSSFVLSIAQEDQRPKSLCVPFICLLFAFNKQGESTRQMCLLSPGIPLRWTGVPGAAEVVSSAWLCLPGEQWEGITKLSHTGLMCCPAAVSICLLAPSKG